MRHLISTRIGERVMRRQYGGGVHQRLQGPNDSTIRNIVRHDLEEAIRTYMPDVILKAPIRVESQDEVMDIFIDYAVRPDDVVRRLQLALG